MNKTVRVRFAPSPTGNLHIGGVRTALFNWLFARHEGGKFLLRLEDTDRERSLPEYEQSILQALEWLGLRHDEPLVRQSSRQERHREIAMVLLAAGKAYRCYCTADELDRLREEQRARKERPRYPGVWRDRNDGDPSQPHTIRLKLPLEGDIGHEDLVLGPHKVANGELDDFVILRTDGTPTYNFVVAVDDHDMGITHVLRGADHISNTAKQLHVYDAMGWPRPLFGHLPNIHGPDGTKLSKRHGATDVIEYRRMGYLPVAVLNYMVRLGWSYGDQEIFTVDEMIAKFSLDAVNRAPATFDIEKMTWVNSEHLRRSRVEEVLPHWLEHLAESGIEAGGKSEAWLRRACDTLRERCKTLAEMTTTGRFLFAPPDTYSEPDCKKWLTPAALPLLEAARQQLERLEGWEAPALHELMQRLISERGVDLKQLAQPLRVVLCGRAVSPPIDISLELLGKAETLARLDRALEAMRAAVG